MWVVINNIYYYSEKGDEVVEWNGRSLQGATFEEVYDIILESKQEPQVELIVHRSVKWVTIMVSTCVQVIARGCTLNRKQ